jgi:hypothetical protein
MTFQRKLRSTSFHKFECLAKKAQEYVQAIIERRINTISQTIVRGIW